jgi:uncharacterized protein YtpQ (UPF0354 family)
MDEVEAQFQPEAIVPMIKARVRGSDKAPLVMRPEETPIIEPLVGDLAVGYAFDLPLFYAMVSPRQCKRLGLAQESLRALAVTNLHALRPDLQVRWAGTTKSAMLTLGGDLEAGLLLSDVLMDYLAPQFSGELVAAVPSRSSLAVTGTAHPDGIAALLRLIDVVWQRGDHLLTRELLVRHNHTWQILSSVTWPEHGRRCQ